MSATPSDLAGADAHEVTFLVELHVQPGRSREFASAVASLIAFVRSEEPEVTRYEFYLSADGSLARAIHVYTSAQAVEHHIHVAESHIDEVRQYVGSSSTVILGDFDGSLLEQYGATPAVFRERVDGFVRQ